MYKRIILKLSGKALSGKNDFGIDFKQTRKIAKEIKQAHKLKIEIGIVIGAGNLWRGSTGTKQGMNRANADEMGMLATIINSLALRDALEKENLPTRLHTALEMKSIAEPYSRLRADYQLKKGYIVIMGGGTGHPYFSTDTTAALRAMELNANVFIKATNVDGIYTDDPQTNPEAKKINKLTYMDCLNKETKVMDNTAITLCMNNNLPILVIDLWKPGNLKKAVQEQTIGSIIKAEKL